MTLVRTLEDVAKRALDMMALQVPWEHKALAAVLDDRRPKSL